MQLPAFAVARPNTRPPNTHPCQVSDVGVAALRRHAGLQRLRLSFCVAISDAALVHVRGASCVLALVCVSQVTCLGVQRPVGFHVTISDAVLMHVRGARCVY